MRSVKLLVLPLALSIFACSESKETEKDVDYYLNNEQERKEKLVLCEKNISNKSINCMNAKRAEAKNTENSIFGEGFERSKP